ncbi:MAG: WXG100 family type VII secretion target [Egibacteraceae bacterium]
MRTLKGLRDQLDDTVWRGEAADAFRQRIDELPPKLDKLHASYEKASQALGAYGKTLTDLQARAATAVGDAGQARRGQRAGGGGPGPRRGPLRSRRRRPRERCGGGPPTSAPRPRPDRPDPPRPPERRGHGHRRAGRGRRPRQPQHALSQPDMARRHRHGPHGAPLYRRRRRSHRHRPGRHRHRPGRRRFPLQPGGLGRARHRPQRRRPTVQLVAERFRIRALLQRVIEGDLR